MVIPYHNRGSAVINRICRDLRELGRDLGSLEKRDLATVSVDPDIKEGLVHVSMGFFHSARPVVKAHQCNNEVRKVRGLDCKSFSFGSNFEALSNDRNPSL